MAPFGKKISSYLAVTKNTNKGCYPETTRGRETEIKTEREIQRNRLPKSNMGSVIPVALLA